MINFQWTCVYQRVQITFSTIFKIKICIFTNILFMIATLRSSFPSIFWKSLPLFVRPRSIRLYLTQSLLLWLKECSSALHWIWATTKNRTRNLRPNRINLIKWQQSFSVKFKMIYVFAAVNSRLFYIHKDTNN